MACLFQMVLPCKPSRGPALRTIRSLRIQCRYDRITASCMNYFKANVISSIFNSEFQEPRMKIIKKSRIDTPRLTLKPYEPQDRERLAELLMNEEITKTFMVPDYPAREQYLELADKLISFSQPEDEVHLECGIFLGSRLIGFINDCGIEDSAIEIGYVIHPEYQKHGYASEAVNAVIHELWDMGFQRITAGFFEENEASRRVMEKCGMTPVDEEDFEEYRGVLHRCLFCEIRR